MAGRDGGAYRLFWFYYASMCALLTHVHSYSLTVFSPSGKLVQIEHALAAVSQGTTSLGIKGTLP
jgi:20S proteasome subunit alpha 2